MTAEEKRGLVWDAAYHVREAQIALIQAGESDLAISAELVNIMCETREKELAREADKEREEIDREIRRYYAGAVL